MMRSLWTAASGMITQQTSLDVIANNMANVNTTSYKKDSAEFKNLLYQTVQARTTSANGENKPIGAQVGLGVRTSAIGTMFQQGQLRQTEETFDFAIDGKGFFQVMGEDGETYYSRNGKFQVAVGNTGLILANQDGLPILDTEGRRIVFDEDSVDVSKLMISTNGDITYANDENEIVELGHTIALVQFSNPAGLDKMGSLLYQQTDASGEPMLEEDTVGIKRSKLLQGYLEGSNVMIADEMVNMIVTQRAYQMNTKAIQAADTMLEQANQLKR